jgi:hypothetical protein
MSTLHVRKMKKVLLILVAIFGILFVVFLSTCKVTYTSDRENHVESSSHTEEELNQVSASIRNFFQELDTQGDTWDLLSKELRESTAKISWSTTLIGFNTVFGKNVERTYKSSTFTDSLPNAPPGRYYICDFDSTFSKMNASERIVLVLEEEDWRIAGYFRSKSIYSTKEEDKP